MSDFSAQVEHMQDITVRLANVGQRIVSVTAALKSLGGQIDQNEALGKLGYGDMVRNVGQVAKRQSKAIDQYAQRLEEIARLYSEYERRVMQTSSVANAVAGAETTFQTGSNETVWGEDNSFVYATTTGVPWVFHLGNHDPSRPEFDNGYPFNPNMQPTMSDYLNWAKWGVISAGAGALGHLPDGVAAYEHYRNGDGSPLEVNFAKAYNQDSVIRENTDRTVAETNRAVQQMIEKGTQPPFTITSECMGTGSDPSTENWQKAIGRYQTWVSADVSYDDKGNVVVNSTVHMWDLYNFNNGQYDIATGEPDDVNGRFEALGWAHSFETHGSIDFQTVFPQGKQIGVPQMASSAGRNRVSYETRENR